MRDCPECGNNMGEPVDKTYSNYNSGRARKGEHTGDVYTCKNCEIRWLDDFLNNKLRPY